MQRSACAHGLVQPTTVGHPLGSTGARLATTLLHALEQTGGRYGLVTMCIGVGQGIAAVVAREN